MFQELLNTVNVKTSTVRALIQTNERLREIVFGRGSVTRQESDEDTELTRLIKGVPGVTDWRVYDHCAVVTRLYAIYERFVENLITDWVRLLPSIFPRYVDLEETIQNTHRTGVGRLLCDLKKNRFEHLSIDQVVQGLFRGVTGEEEYALLPDAFLLHEQNLRKGVLEQLLAGAGIQNAWAWVEKHRAVKHFLEVRVSENTAEGELNELVTYRNEAAHGAVIDNFLGSNALLELCEFIETLCQALAELVTYQVIEQQKSIGQVREIGRITEWFKKSRAAVAKVEETTLSVRGSLFLVGETYCQLATIESIRIDDVDQETVKTTSGMEVGFKFDVDAREGLRLYMVW
ncbi:hypothetical protein H6F98_07500 [Microcoleus sp. FACHB-SPT15]|uniref:MAE_28990/MAE_18760 family HEPN-like nuclease n=1 Tax=Microcoleus sp. FACHB-SPT15 TaxID=2692830 RepID=UPI00178550BE|nr:MAE_28990/MAE_18760 family HEPN-like nuclease [Microcoleus sp. FACHB-SPT15]MBD1805293.1 hypothetical protein [Microcoleus sp. FACHB-SPT15]